MRKTALLDLELAAMPRCLSLVVSRVLREY